MSLHPRQIIREAVVAALLGKTDAGLRVYASRIRPWRGKKLPAIGVYLDTETADHEDSAPRRYFRSADIRVEIVAEADEALDAVFDAVALQVETALLVDPTLGGKADDLEFERTETNLSADGDTLLGACALIFSASYETRPPEPVLDDLETVSVRYDLAEPDGDIDAEDTITMPTEEEA